MGLSKVVQDTVELLALVDKLAGSINDQELLTNFTRKTFPPLRFILGTE
jgi:hypothetical protein